MPNQYRYRLSILSEINADNYWNWGGSNGCVYRYVLNSVLHFAEKADSIYMEIVYSVVCESDGDTSHHNSHEKAAVYSHIYKTQTRRRVEFLIQHKVFLSKHSNREKCFSVESQSQQIDMFLCKSYTYHCLHQNCLVANFACCEGMPIEWILPIKLTSKSSNEIGST